MNKGCKGANLLILMILFFLPLLLQGQTSRSIPPIKQKNTALTPDGLKALNACVNYINEIVYQTRWLQQGLVAYNLHANYFHGVDFSSNEADGNLTFSAPNFNMTDSITRLARMGISNLPTKYQKELAIQLDSVNQIFLEMSVLYQRLSYYIRDQKYKKDNLKGSNEILSAYEDLFNSLDRTCGRFDHLLTEIYVNHLHSKEEDKWDKMYGSLNSLIDKNAQLYDAIKFQFKFRNDSSFNQLTVQALNLERWLRRYTLAETLIESSSSDKKKMIQEIYQGIMEQSLAMSMKSQQLQPSYFEDHLTYERLTFNLNQSVYLFNKFTELAPKTMLKKTQQVFLYRHLRLPEDDDVEVEPLITETPLNWVDMENYAPNHLLLLLDVSQSMNDDNKLPLLKRSIRHLIPIMRAEDSLSIVVFSKGSELVLPPTSLKNQHNIIKAISSLEPSGSTNFSKGLTLAYETAEKHFIENGNNRIIIATDGQFNLDKRNFRLVKKYEKVNIQLTIFKYGNENKKTDKRLYKLARKGSGNYEWIDEGNSDIMLLKEVQAKKKTNTSPIQDSDD